MGALPSMLATPARLSREELLGNRGKSIDGMSFGFDWTKVPYGPGMALFEILLPCPFTNGTESKLKPLAWDVDDVGILGDANCGDCAGFDCNALSFSLKRDSNSSKDTLHKQMLGPRRTCDILILVSSRSKRLFGVSVGSTRGVSETADNYRCVIDIGMNGRPRTLIKGAFWMGWKLDPSRCMGNSIGM